METITIIVVDDHTLIRQLWCFVLDSSADISVVGEAASAEEGIALVEKLKPTVVLMDINLPGMNGIEATKEVKKVSPHTNVLGVSLHTQPTYAKKMMQNGASGYVTKNSSREEMFTAIAEIMKGNKYICSEIKNILSEQMLSETESKKGPGDLSHREMEVISLIKEGFTSKEIAVRLTLSVKTVEVHRYNILKKLNVKNTVALVNYINTQKLEFIKS